MEDRFEWPRLAVLGPIAHLLVRTVNLTPQKGDAQTPAGTFLMQRLMRSYPSRQSRKRHGSTRILRRIIWCMMVRLSADYPHSRLFQILYCMLISIQMLNGWPICPITQRRSAVTNGTSSTLVDQSTGRLTCKNLTGQIPLARMEITTTPLAYKSLTI